MALLLFNTLTRTKEVFIPLAQGKVKMYSCGPTVYNYVHIGNLRCYVFNDLLKRTLLHLGLSVTHVMNLTDVDDKTIRDSQKAKKSLRAFTDFYADAFFKDCEELRILKPDEFTRATDFIPQMIQLIEQLIAKGHAYEKKGTVYYKIDSMQDYGELAHLDVDHLKKNADGRLQDSDEYDKENVRDFALWKGWDAADGDVAWESPWGKGRPGWHIECSVMSMARLGNHFDVHTGGVDLIFPHHTNEIAQSEGATGERYVNYWLHNAHLIVNGEKMSKSAGNFFTLRDLLAKGYDVKSVRYALLSVHYRQQLNFTFESIDAAKTAIQRFQAFYDRLDELTDKGNVRDAVKNACAKAQIDFTDALSDDLNISGAMAAVHEFMNDMNRLIAKDACNAAESELAKATCAKFDAVLGILDEKGDLDEEIQLLVDERENARMSRNFKRSDELRDLLKEKGIILEDTPQGVRWKRG